MTECRIVSRLPDNPLPVRRFGFDGGNAPPSQGLLVEFKSRSSGPWVGDFELGPWTEHSSLVRFPDGRRYAVLADGFAYLVDPERMAVDRQLSDVAISAYPVPDLGVLVINWHGIVFE